MNAKRVNIGGVPEHFNMPWHVGINSELFLKEGAEICWHDYKTGTGAMLGDLENGGLDMALLLTEGAITGIAKGADIKILQWYVQSPLTWGIHSAHNSSINNIDSIFTKKYAISRFGSGSHLMAKIHASYFKHNLEDSQFVIVNNLDGAEQALVNNTASIFFWEKYTTKHLVDQNIFRRIGEFPTPWPCFVWVVTNDFYHKNKSLVTTLQTIINDICTEFKSNPAATSIIAEKYNLMEQDVKDWLVNVQWNSRNSLEVEELEACTSTLKTLNIIPLNFETSDLVFNNS